MKKARKVLSVLLAVVMALVSIPLLDAPAIAAGDEITANGTCGDNIWWTFENGTLTVGGSGAIEPLTRTGENGEPETYFPWNEVLSEKFLEKYNISDMDELVEKAGNDLNLWKKIYSDIYLLVREIVIDEGITSIPSHCFDPFSSTLACFPRTVSLPESLERIDEDGVCGIFAEKIIIKNSTLPLEQNILVGGFTQSAELFTRRDRFDARLLEALVAPIESQIEYFEFFTNQTRLAEEYQALGKVITEGTMAAYYVALYIPLLASLRADVAAGTGEAAGFTEEEKLGAYEEIDEMEAYALGQVAPWLNDYGIEVTSLQDALAKLIALLNEKLETNYTTISEFASVIPCVEDDPNKSFEVWGDYYILEYGTVLQSKLDALEAEVEDIRISIERLNGELEASEKEASKFFSTLGFFYLGSSPNTGVIHDETGNLQVALLTPVPWSTVYGYEGSTAQAAAETSGVHFVALDPYEPTIIPTDDPNIILQGTCGDRGDNVIWTLTKDRVLTVSGSGDMYGMDATIEDINKSPERYMILNHICKHLFNTAYLKILHEAGYDYDSFEEAEAASKNGEWSRDEVFTDEAIVRLVDIIRVGLPTTIIVEEGITGIGAGAFLYQSENDDLYGFWLESVSLPSTLTAIGDFAFYNNVNLKDISIPENVQRIGARAFAGPAVTNLVLPEACTSVGYDAFSLRTGGVISPINIYVYNDSLSLPLLIPAFSNTIDTSILTTDNLEACMSKANLAGAVLAFEDLFSIVAFMEDLSLPYESFSAKHPSISQEAFEQEKEALELQFPIYAKYYFSGIESIVDIIGSSLEVPSDLSFDTFPAFFRTLAEECFLKIKEVFEIEIPTIEDIYQFTLIENASHRIDISVNLTQKGEQLNDILQPYNELFYETTTFELGKVPAKVSYDDEENEVIGDPLIPFPWVTVYGHEGSTVQAEAAVSGVKFVALDASTPEHTHTLTNVPAKAATCKDDGNIEYWVCSDPDCGKYFSDANGENEIADKNSVVVSKTTVAHTPKTVYTKASTCTVKGYELHECEVCGIDLPTTYFDYAPHDLGDWEIKEQPTTEKEGKKIRRCKNCDYFEEDRIPKLETKTITNPATGVQVTYEEGSFNSENVRVDVQETFTGSQFLTRQYDKIVEWNIKILSGNKEIQPEKPVTVRIPLPAGFDSSSIKVYHVNSKTQETEIVRNVRVENGYIIFTAYSFSVYIVVDESSEVKPSEPTTDSDKDKTPDQPSGKVCKYCGEVHEGFFQKIIGFFHSILALFGLKKK